MHQVLIASKPIVNKSKRDANLLIEYLLSLQKLFQSETNKPKPRNQPQKILVAKSSKKDKADKKTRIKNIAIEDGNINKLDKLIQADIIKPIKTNLSLNPKRIRTQSSFDPKLRTDLRKTIGKNPLVIDGLIRLVYKVSKSVIETSSKGQEPKIYN